MKTTLSHRRPQVWYHWDRRRNRDHGCASLRALLFVGRSIRQSHLPLQEAGALLNGSTNADRTNYWEVVPRNALELALWMESDRMGYLLPALTSAKVENQREVVLNERRQNYENRPYGFAGMAVVAALYPPDHPYHWVTIGGADDIRAARLDDVRAFFQTYYRPRNASLALAGDVDTGDALEMAARYFGDLDAGDEPPQSRVAADALVGRAAACARGSGRLARLYASWHSARALWRTMRSSILSAEGWQA